MNKKETETLEFKKSTSELKDAVKSICAILNKHSKGRLVFGIKSGGEVLGQGISEKTLRDVSQQVSNSIEPRIFPKIHEEKIKGKKCVVVEFEGSEVPYFAYGRAYIRVGDEDRILSAKELEKFILNKNKNSTRWDYEICRGANLNDLDKKSITSFRERYKGINKIELKGSDKDILKSLGCLRRVKGKLRVTNAGILLFNSSPEKLFPMAYVTIARYPGIEKGNEYLDIKDFYGNLFDLIDNAEKYMKENIKERSEIIEGRIPRKVIPQYPYYAIREILTNAVVHRDYSVRGSRIIIRMFKNRIEFNSPGNLPGEITPENIVYEQYSRNPIISEVLGKIKYIEKIGEGWDKIIDSFKKTYYKTKMPNILDTGNTVIVTIFSPGEMLEEGGKNGGKNGGKQSQQQRQDLILKKIKKGIFNERDFAREMGVGKNTVRRDIQALKGKIEFIGSKKKGRWVVK